MRHADICKDADVGTGNLCQPGHLAEIADSHFQHRYFMFLADVEYSKRKSDLVVEVPFCLEDRVFLGQDRCDHFFSACFAHTSGNTDYFDIKRAAVMFCDIFQCLLAG